MTLRLALLAALLLLLPGCLVWRSTYREEVARADRLGETLRARELEIEKLERRARDLQKTGENLEIERSSLDAERVALAQELEELREGNARVREELERERVARLSSEDELSKLSGTYRSLVEELEQEVASGQIEIQELQGRLQVRALDKILFSPGSTAIKPEGKELLTRLAAKLREFSGQPIRVEGHTDNVPIQSDRFPSNWELSVARAVVVVRFLAAQGLDPAQLAAVGHGEHQPLESNDTPEGRSRNRRIEIILTAEP